MALVDETETTALDPYARRIQLGNRHKNEMAGSARRAAQVALVRGSSHKSD